MVGGNFWTKEEVDILRQEYPRRTMEELLNLFEQNLLRNKAERLKSSKGYFLWRPFLKPAKIKPLSDFWKAYLAGFTMLTIISRKHTTK